MTTKQLLLWASLAHEYYINVSDDFNVCLVLTLNKVEKGIKHTPIDQQVALAISAQYSKDTIKQLYERCD